MHTYGLHDLPAVTCQRDIMNSPIQALIEGRQSQKYCGAVATASQPQTGHVAVQM